MNKVFLALGVLALSACASYRPILDENSHYEKVGDAQAEKDIDVCLAKAEKFMEKHKSERMKKEVGRGAAKGAIIGGVVGVLSGGKTLQRAAVGAGVGAGVGAAGSAAGQASKDKLSPDGLKQNYVSRCLARKGYDVIGWK